MINKCFIFKVFFIPYQSLKKKTTDKQDFFFNKVAKLQKDNECVDMLQQIGFHLIY